MVGTRDFVLEEDSGDCVQVSSRCAGARAELCGVLEAGLQPGTGGAARGFGPPGQVLGRPRPSVMGGGGGLL